MHFFRIPVVFKIGKKQIWKYFYNFMIEFKWDNLYYIPHFLVFLNCVLKIISTFIRIRVLGFETEVEKIFEKID
jgi:ABC-type phosphate/phosphonate transport system permease subunit